MLGKILCAVVVLVAGVLFSVIYATWNYAPGQGSEEVDKLIIQGIGITIIILLLSLIFGARIYKIIFLTIGIGILSFIAYIFIIVLGETLKGECIEILSRSMCF
jgi:hypothetical protein